MSKLLFFKFIITPPIKTWFFFFFLKKGYPEDLFDENELEFDDVEFDDAEAQLVALPDLPTNDQSMITAGTSSRSDDDDYELPPLTGVDVDEPAPSTSTDNGQGTPVQMQLPIYDADAQLRAYNKSVTRAKQTLNHSKRKRPFSVVLANSSDAFGEHEHITIETDDEDDEEMTETIKKQKREDELCKSFYQDSSPLFKSSKGFAEYLCHLFKDNTWHLNEIEETIECNYANSLRERSVIMYFDLFLRSIGVHSIQNLDLVKADVCMAAFMQSLRNTVDKPFCLSDPTLSRLSYNQLPFTDLYRQTLPQITRGMVVLSSLVSHITTCQIKSHVCSHSMSWIGSNTDKLIDSASAPLPLQSCEPLPESLFTRFHWYTFQSTDRNGRLVLAKAMDFDSYFASNPIDYPSIPMFLAGALAVISSEGSKQIENYNKCFSHYFALLEARKYIITSSDSDTSEYYRKNVDFIHDMKPFTIFQNMNMVSTGCVDIAQFPVLSAQDRVTMWNFEIFHAFSIWKWMGKFRQNGLSVPSYETNATTLTRAFLTTLCCQQDNLFRFWCLVFQYSIAGISVDTSSETNEYHFGVNAFCAFCGFRNQIAVGSAKLHGLQKTPVLRVRASFSCRCRMPDMLAWLLNCSTDFDLPHREMFPKYNILCFGDKLRSPHTSTHPTSQDLLNYSLAIDYDLLQDEVDFELATILFGKLSEQEFRLTAKQLVPGLAIKAKDSFRLKILTRCPQYVQFMKNWAHKYPVKYTPEASWSLIQDKVPKHMVVAMGIFRINESINTHNLNQDQPYLFAPQINDFVYRTFLPSRKMKTLFDAEDDLCFYFCAYVAQKFHFNADKDTKSPQLVSLIPRYEINDRLAKVKTEYVYKPFYQEQKCSRASDKWSMTRFANFTLAKNYYLIDIIAAIYEQDIDAFDVYSKYATTNHTQKRIKYRSLPGGEMAEKMSHLYTEEATDETAVHPLLGCPMAGAQLSRTLLKQYRKEAIALKETLKEKEIQLLCLICQSEQAVWVTNPCGHAAACDKCYQRGRARANDESTFFRKCGKCRQENITFLRIYL